MAIGTGLDDGGLAIHIATPARSSAHTEVADNTETARLQGVVGEQADIYESHIGISARRLITKQVGKHLRGRGYCIIILPIVTILNNHYSKRNRNAASSKLLQMKAEIQVFHLDTLTYDVVHLGALRHTGVKHWVQVGIIIQSDGGKRLEPAIGRREGDGERVVVLLDLRGEAAVDRGNFRT